MCTILKETVPQHFTITVNQRKRKEWTDTTEELFLKSATTRRERRWEEAADINKEFRKQLREDKAKQMMKEFEEDLDLRSKWMGLRMLRKGYTPSPYHRKDTMGDTLS